VFNYLLVASIYNQIQFNLISFRNRNRKSSNIATFTVTDVTLRLRTAIVNDP